MNSSDRECPICFFVHINVFAIYVGPGVIDCLLPRITTKIFLQVSLTSYKKLYRIIGRRTFRQTEKPIGLTSIVSKRDMNARSTQAEAGGCIEFDCSS